ncbi:hypothetical protein ACOKQT_17965 [Vibrio cholerae]|uniref:hypothetical protein n=1 Tax=Vibrio cholerae TaxID=666 RepID=UPI0039C90E5C
MKKSTFENMIKNPPQGATHYRRFRKYVVFYKNVDNSFGSYASLLWWASDSSPESEKFEDEYNASWERQIERLDYKMKVGLIKDLLLIFSAFPISLFLGYILSGGNL